MKFGSLFSGIGGFDLGFERAGMECAWQCEIDKNCQSLLQKRFGVQIYDDVRTITAGNAEPVDVICGGFPCQDVSIAGKRAGFAGERSGLWTEFARIIEELKPGWVVIENVPGLLSSNQGRDFQTVLDQMVESGYGVCWRILDAQYFGVAQRRRRVFIVGSLGNGRSAEVLFESEGVRWNPPARGKEGQGTTGETSYSLTFCDANGTRNDRPNGGLYVNEVDKSNTLAGAGNGGIKVVAYENHPADSRITETGDISQPITSRMVTGGNNVPLIANWQSGGGKMDDDVAASLRSGAEVNYQFAYNTQVLNDQGGSQMSITENVCAKLRTQEHGHQPLVMATGNTNAEIVSDGSPSLTVNHEQPIVAFETGQGYWQEGETTGTLRSEGENRPSRPSNIVAGVRRLTPTECERLQGFPDGWTAGQSDSTRYKQLGNAVAVPVAEWIGTRIKGESK